MCVSCDLRLLMKNVKRKGQGKWGKGEQCVRLHLNNCKSVCKNNNMSFLDKINQDARKKLVILIAKHTSHLDVQVWSYNLNWRNSKNPYFVWSTRFLLTRCIESKLPNQWNSETKESTMRKWNGFIAPLIATFVPAFSFHFHHFA